MNLFQRSTLAAAVLACALPAAAVDGSASFNGSIATSTEMTGSTYAGMLSILGDVLTLSLDTSGPLTGFLTGIAFNTPSGAVTSQLTAPSNFVFDAVGTAQPFGTFDVVTAVSGDFEGGGNPSNGVAIGSSGTWTFQLSDSSFAVGDFFQGVGNEPGFVARFRGLPGQPGSDKVPSGGFVGDPPPPIPEPSTYALMAGGLMAMVWLNRRRRQD